MLDRETRWFACAGVVLQEPTAYESVCQVVLDAGGALLKRSAINAALKDKVTERSITRHLKRAVQRGEIISPKTGYYSALTANGQ
jgi:hypothetical protein